MFSLAIKLIGRACTGGLKKARVIAAAVPDYAACFGGGTISLTLSQAITLVARSLLRWE